ncbi:CHAD domain-containing protein [Cylindrospermum sp. FACHB-282]|uniref:CHAD domain-containing protein n=1 Tax=Cylindrospermum sp. FACHB-282 TaxID=2692794 RepID=UPI001686D3E0|nr:CHAD domain-containing protein [Cylindrospermum sp. FACHB-282]MBD2386891.1 CHAD domain-containing protein [Cylindrospermum sp. FACHB-282]
MKLATKTTANTLGDYAYQAIEKHAKKTWKWEKAVKKDEDPEALHQMRVGMRRLRTDISKFGLALDLSKPVSEKNIAKIARTLGNLRDLDVLKEALENNYIPHLRRKEQASLQTAFGALSKQREIELANVQKTLKDEHYKSVKQGFQDWLEKPNYQPLASLSIQQVLPDLLLPAVSTLLLHPGWLIGTQIVNSEVVIPTDWTSEKLEEQLATQGETLHSLRKQAKRVRYQMELFTEIYGESFAAHIAEVKNIQEILGAMQDSMVLAEWLVDIFKSETRTQLGGLTALLAENRYNLWQQWQPIQERYLKAETRHSFHLTILHSL